MYVQRNTDGAIVGAYANEQDYAIEWLDDDSDELTAFLAATSPSVSADPVTKLKDFLAANPDVAALLGA